MFAQVDISMISSRNITVARGPDMGRISEASAGSKKLRRGGPILGGVAPVASGG